MKFSVLINNYNNAPYLSECLESVLHQSRRADEIVVVDDGSTDSSPMIIEQYVAQFPVIKPIYQQNRGQLSALATAIASSSGDILFLLDGDDAYKAHHLESIEKYWLHYPHIDLIYTRTDLIGRSSLSASQIQEHEKKTRHLIGPVNNVLEHYQWGYSALLAYWDPWYYMGNTTSSLALKREHASSLKLEELAHHIPLRLGNADYALLLQSALHLGRKLYIPDETVLYRIHEHSLSQRIHRSDDQSSEHYRWLMNMLLIRDQCLKNYTFHHSSFPWEFLEEEIKTIPYPSEAHLEHYKMITKLARGRTQQLEETIKKRDAQLHSVYNSLSWKLTKPLRKVGEIISAKLQ